MYRLRPLLLAGLAVFFVLVLTGASGSSTAAIRYVAKSGNNGGNNCLDPDQPCATLQHALDMAAPGDTLAIAEGTYVENIEITKEITLSGGYEATNWTRDFLVNATILDGSAAQVVAGDWDGSQVRKATVLKDGDDYLMWYDGMNVLKLTQVGFATSTDGTTWTKSASNPVLDGVFGGWDARGEHAAFVLKDDSVYKMWYEGTNAQGIRQLGYATSPDGVAWTKYPGNPVLQPGPDGFDSEAVGHGTVLKEDGVYKLWYHAIGDAGPVIAYATSADGISWTKSGPVLTPAAGRWDEGGLWGPSVIKVEDTYWMWYSAFGPMGPPAIGAATSSDGITWQRVGTQPVLSDLQPPSDPVVILDGETLKMWYTDLLDGVINFAESRDGINWTVLGSNPVLEPGGTLADDPGAPVVDISDAGSVTLDGFMIRRGRAASSSAGVAFENTDVTIIHCLIINNLAYGNDIGGAVGGSGPLHVENSIISVNALISPRDVGNTGGASAIRTGDATTIFNAMVTDNLGDAAVHVNDDLSMMNVTLTYNDAGIIFSPASPSTLEVTNSIVYDNFAWAVGGNCGGDSSCVIRYSDIEGGWSGVNNLDVDPRFVDPEIGNYHLAPDSPLIDAGTNMGAPLIDLDGDRRPLDGNLDGTAVTDIGSDEFLTFMGNVPVIIAP